jgi:hypothetical protein
VSRAPFRVVADASHVLRLPTTGHVRYSYSPARRCWPCRPPSVYNSQDAGSFPLVQAAALGSLLHGSNSSSPWKCHLTRRRTCVRCRRCVTCSLSTNGQSTEPAHLSVDPGTSIEFPKHIRVNAKVPLPIYTLLGCGTRTVSFLGIKVYSIGFYADITNPRLKNISKTATPEQKIAFIVDNTSCLIRISASYLRLSYVVVAAAYSWGSVPTRNTSYTHLRDAFLRTLNALIQKGIVEKTMSVDEATAVQSPIGQLKSLFPNSKFAKHEPLDLLITPPDPPQPRVLIIRDLGAVPSNWVSKSLFLSYFGVTAPSPPVSCRSVFCAWSSVNHVCS